MKLILGTMTFADQTNEATALEMMSLFSEKQHIELDTAHQYNDGKTEILVGKLLRENTQFEFQLATKAHPWNDEGLKPGQVEKQFTESLTRLQCDGVDLLYLHSPDLDTPIVDTLEKVWECYQQGKFKRFGLSNFAAWQVAEVVEICRSRGWMVPTVYQGMYNALTRDVERELFPCLRNYGISFYVYNPLAGGLLTGKYKSHSKAPQSGRFLENDAYLSRYWKADYFSVLSAFTEACAEQSISPGDAALRWLVHHSMLDTHYGDGVILGASKFDHLKQNLAAMSMKPLPMNIVDLLDRGWGKVKADCFKYFRP